MAVSHQPSPPPRRAIGTLWSRRRWLIALAAVVVAGALAAPLVAYVIIPNLVRSTVNEGFPTAAAPTPGAVEGAPSPTASLAPAARTLAQGELQRINAVDFGSGGVFIADVGGARFLRFENVSIAGAPDMYVYLSDRSDGKPGNYTDLGKLKATNGSFNYELPATVELRGVNSVVVWCRAFNVTITFAPLRK